MNPDEEENDVQCMFNPCFNIVRNYLSFLSQNPLDVEQVNAIKEQLGELLALKHVNGQDQILFIDNFFNYVKEKLLEIVLERGFFQNVTLVFNFEGDSTKVEFGNYFESRITFTFRIDLSHPEPVQDGAMLASLKALKDQGALMITATKKIFEILLNMAKTAAKYLVRGILVGLIEFAKFLIKLKFGVSLFLLKYILRLISELCSLYKTVGDEGEKYCKKMLMLLENIEENVIHETANRFLEVAGMWLGLLKIEAAKKIKDLKTSVLNQAKNVINTILKFINRMFGISTKKKKKDDKEEEEEEEEIKPRRNNDKDKDKGRGNNKRKREEDENEPAKKKRRVEE